MSVLITISESDQETNYTAYVLWIREGMREWTTLKRYSEFVELDGKLKGVGGISLKELPEKGRLGLRKSINSRGFMLKRRQGLQEYLLHLIVGINKFDDIPILANWLGAHQAPALPAQPSGATKTTALPAQELTVLDASVVAGFKTQKQFFASGATRSVGWRCAQIKKLCTAVHQNAERISMAQFADGVTPSEFAGSAGMLMGAMGYYLGKVAEWAAPTLLEDTIAPERSGGIDCDWLQVKEPKGLVLNIAPWNAPVLLSVLPILGAFAAGNCCVIKPPDACPTVSALLKELVAANLSPEALTVVEGGADVVNGLIDLGFDHIMFTGGTAIGKLIMARASMHLTPVTLELGGKNPVMIDDMDDEFMAAVIKELVGTKAYFAGEFCQCHDYLLVLDSMWDKFTKALGDSIEALGDKRYVRLIHERHYNRVKKMMTDHHGTCLPPIPIPDDSALRLPVTAILEPNAEDFVMQDEVFGPCWSVVKVSSISEAIARAVSMPTGKPLVSYYYGQLPEHAQKWMESTSSGCLAINSGPMRMQSNFNAAVHGVGNSGLGGASIWGQHVFDTFSHQKHVVRPRGNAFAGSIWGAGPYLGASKCEDAQSAGVNTGEQS